MKTLESSQKELARLFSVAAIIITCDPQRYQMLIEAIDSLLQQSYKIDEIIIVASGGTDLGEKISTAYGEYKNIKVLSKNEILSPTQGRNAGIQIAKSDIIAFTDDDATADKYWIDHLVETYRKMDAIAVGGKILPIWSTTEPAHLPKELYWLVGSTDESFSVDKVAEIRSTFGPNMSFKKTSF